MPIVSGKYQNPGWRNGQAPAINATELNAISDTLEKLDEGGGGSGASPFIVIGSVQSGAREDTVDYLCTGSNDNEIIQEAIRAAQNGNKAVAILEGSYYFSAGISMNSANLVGIGSVYFYANSDSMKTMITISGDSSIENIQFIEFVPYNNTDNAQFIVVNQNANVFLKNIVGPMNSTAHTFWVEAGYSPGASICMDSCTLYKPSFHSLKNSQVRNCVIDWGNGLTTGGVDWCGTYEELGIQFLGNELHQDLDAKELYNCSFIGNSFFGDFQLSSQQGGSNPCALNVINSNVFTGGSITLRQYTAYNVVTGNGGVATSQGGSFTPWAGITDQGSNNFVSNNMPT